MTLPCLFGVMQGLVQRSAPRSLLRVHCPCQSIHQPHNERLSHPLNLGPPGYERIPWNDSLVSFRPLFKLTELNLGTVLWYDIVLAWSSDNGKFGARQAWRNSSEMAKIEILCAISYRLHLSYSAVWAGSEGSGLGCVAIK